MDKGPVGGFGANSGEARRFRLREFHEKKNRSPGFHARIAEDFGPSPAAGGERPESFQWKAPPVQSGVGNGGRPRRLAGILSIVAVLAVASGFAAVAGFVAGREKGKLSATREIVERAKTLKRLPETGADLLYKAMTDLRAGRADSSLEILRSLRTKHPQTASLSYLAASAALQAGQVVAAENFVNDSLKAGQRLSDSLALMAVLEQQKKGAAAGSRAEDLLRAAITADPANPAPHLELAALLRQSDRREEARRELQMAQSLLTPVDAHAVSRVTLALMDLEETPDDRLPAATATPRNLAEALVAANISLRRGDFTAAVELLKAGRDMTNPDIFYYLTSDPVFRRYRERPELAGFLQ